MTALLPPHDLSAEKAVLSAVLLEPDAFWRVSSMLDDRSWQDPRHRLIWTATVGLAEMGQPIDAVTVAGWLKSRERFSEIGTPYLAEVTDSSPSLANLEAHAEIVREKARRRKLLAAGQWIAGHAWDESVSYFEESERRVFEVCSEKATAETASPLGEIIVKAFADIQAAGAAGKRATGLSTGFPMLDDLTSGMHDGDLTIIAARPGMGKTSFALNIATNVAAPVDLDDGQVPGGGVAVFSLEMPRPQIAIRMACSEGRVDVGKVRKAILNPDDWSRLTAASSFLSQIPIVIDDKSGITMMDVRSRLRREAMAFERQGRRLRLVIIDYLQLMRGRGDNREQEISGITRGLKELAKDFSVPVIALSQLNRSVETRSVKDKRPQLSDLRESGAIEQDADNVFFIYRDEYYNKDSTLRGIAELIVAKQRNGPVGKVPLRFTGSCTRFDGLEPREVPNEWMDE